MIIVLEGCDCVGKSSIADVLTKRLNAINIHAPSDKAVALSPERQDIASSVFCYAWDIADIFTRVVFPNTANGKHVILDRAWPSTMVYQGERLEELGIENPKEEIKETCSSMIMLAALEWYAKNNTAPGKLLSQKDSYVVIIDAPLDIIKKRMEARGGKDEYENVPDDVVEKRRQQYLEMTSEDLLYFNKIVVRTTEEDTPETMADKIIEAINMSLKGYKKKPLTDIEEASISN